MAHPASSIIPSHPSSCGHGRAQSRPSRSDERHVTLFGIMGAEPRIKSGAGDDVDGVDPS
ncbi:hypothetical protein J4G37_20705 [Microvirga sp. 3-52]|nr:hypothetical protein [Microvirga sp. 3-52]